MINLLLGFIGDIYERRKTYDTQQLVSLLVVGTCR